MMRGNSPAGYGSFALAGTLACFAALLAVVVPSTASDGTTAPSVEVQLLLVTIVAVGALTDVGTTWLYRGPVKARWAQTPWVLIGALLLPLGPAIAVAAVAGLASGAVLFGRRTAPGTALANIAATAACQLSTEIHDGAGVEGVLLSVGIGHVALIAVRAIVVSIWRGARPLAWRPGGAPVWVGMSEHLATYAVASIACLLSPMSAPAIALLVPVTPGLVRAQQARGALWAARMDEKTGLLRHQEWRRRALVAVESRRTRNRSSVAVVIIDLDHFKLLNDTHGHVAGDLVLQEVADCLRATFRKDDVVGRFGGEEFTILLPHTNLADGIAAANRAVERVRLISLEGGIRVTASAGVAAYPTHGQSLTELLEAADLALYQAKSSGRDRVQAA